jgi:hypothetical protein
MGLYCLVCGHGVEDGLNVCVFCHNGYTSQLACSVCKRPVDRGSASCWSCGRRQSASSPPVAMTYDPPALPSSQSSSLARLPDLPPLPGLSERLAASQTLPERYTVSAHGIVADIKVNAVNATVMQHEAQLAAVLESVADEVGRWMVLHGLEISPVGSDAMRTVARNCRILAVNLKEEIELIQGSKHGIPGMPGPSLDPNWHGFAPDRAVGVPVDTILLHLRQLIAALTVFADESNFKLGHGDVARANIKDCRMLAISIKELLELMQSQPTVRG